MAEPRLQIKGQARVTQDEQNAAFVDGTNSGMFRLVQRSEVGITRLFIDEEWSTNPRDVYCPTPETTGWPVCCSFERVSETQIMVFCFLANGEAVDADFSVTCRSQFIG